MCGAWADPTAGAGGFEALTEALAEAAWAEFQAIEREGGVVGSLETGALQARIGQVRAKREQDVAARRAPITGTSEFPDIRERPVEVLIPSPRASGEGASGEGLSRVSDFAPLPSIRVAESFEKLRDVADEIIARTGSRPAVFLANLGPPSAFGARASFAGNAFETGGLQAVTADGTNSPEAVAAAFRASGARIACICSSDSVYATQAIGAAEVLKAAGAARIYLAGRPGTLQEPLKAAGVHDYLSAGCDLVALLGRALAEYGD